MSEAEQISRLKREIKADVGDFFVEYSDIIDNKRWEAYEELFTKDSELEYDNKVFGLQAGKKGDLRVVAKWLKGMMNQHSDSQHLISTISVDFPESVTKHMLESRKDLVVKAKGKLVNSQRIFFLSYLCFGTYHHELVYEEGRWKSRKLVSKNRGSLIPVASIEQIGAAIVLIASYYLLRA